MTGHDDLILELLLAGANPNLPDPAMGLGVLHDASRDGFEGSVRVLLQHGADANMVDGKGNLPLHLAAQEGHLGVVQLLFGYTENPEQRNNDGATFLQLLPPPREPGKSVRVSDVHPEPENGFVFGRIGPKFKGRVKARNNLRRLSNILFLFVF